MLISQVLQFENKNSTHVIIKQTYTTQYTKMSGNEVNKTLLKPNMVNLQPYELTENGNQSIYFLYFTTARSILFSKRWL